MDKMFFAKSIKFLPLDSNSLTNSDLVWFDLNNSMDDEVLTDLFLNISNCDGCFDSDGNTICSELSDFRDSLRLRGTMSSSNSKGKQKSKNSKSWGDFE